MLKIIIFFSKDNRINGNIINFIANCDSLVKKILLQDLRSFVCFDCYV